MIIKSFKASKVHEYYDFNFDFSKELNFLVGINGTGKTSALKLMQAALSIDLSVLLSTSFKYLEIQVVDGLKTFNLSISSSLEKMTFLLNGVEFVFERIEMFRVSQGSVSAAMQEYIENNRLELIKRAGPILQQFIFAGRPMFLGLERRMGRFDDDDRHHEVWSKDGHRRMIKLPPKETLEGLENCQRLVEKAYMNYRRASDGRVDRLSNVIIESTFEYIEFDPAMIEDPSKNPYVELYSLQQRKSEVEKFVRDLGGSDKVVAQIDSFFSKLSGIVGDNKGHKDAWSFEWFLNMAQIQRIRKILAEMDRQKKFAERFYAPIKEFCETMNSFLRSSRKELTVDSVGKIKIFQGGKTVDLLSLSSGEKQLLILMAHARFGSVRGRTFIVDEPELSLHMRWQEMLVEALIAGNQDNQFIFATHSPEIVGYHTDKCISVG
ncbi:AAA family ATPase [Pseudomonas sp. B19125]|uniref:AAA family ATPase n=1 Tax=Pseudomonas sp. B19125 TaxID=3235109 RepID=UPI0037833660